MNIDLIDEPFVRQAAHSVGLELAPEHLAGVIMYFKMIAGMAALVNEFPLDENIENAAIYIPCSMPTLD
jgi:hypothetical protein